MAAMREPKAAEDEIIRRIVAVRKRKLSPATTNLRIAAPRSFLEHFAELPEGSVIMWMTGQQT